MWQFCHGLPLQTSVHLQTTLIMPWYITVFYFSLPPTLSSQIAVGQYEDLLGWCQLKLCGQETLSHSKDPRGWEGPQWHSTWICACNDGFLPIFNQRMHKWYQYECWHRVTLNSNRSPWSKSPAAEFSIWAPNNSSDHHHIHSRS